MGGDVLFGNVVHQCVRSPYSAMHNKNTWFFQQYTITTHDSYTLLFCYFNFLYIKLFVELVSLLDKTILNVSACFSLCVLISYSFLCLSVSLRFLLHTLSFHPLICFLVYHIFTLLFLCSNLFIWVLLSHSFFPCVLFSYFVYMSIGFCVHEFLTLYILCLKIPVVAGDQICKGVFNGRIFGKTAASIKHILSQHSVFDRQAHVLVRPRRITFISSVPWTNSAGECALGSVLYPQETLQGVIRFS